MALRETQAIVIQETGGPEVMQVQTVPVEAPKEDAVRIAHRAIGLNYIDTYQRSGLYPLDLPSGLGMEGAGEVLEVGAAVAHLQVGDRVAYTSQPPGSYSQERVLPALAVCKLPASITFETGAAMMLKGMTALYLLRRTLPQGGLEKGDFVLFHAAAGGLGLIACQLARALGLQLIGTAGSAAKCALAREYGAAHCINYAQEDFVAALKDITGEQGVKVVYDSVGQATFERSLECLRPFGLMVSFGNASGAVPPVNLGLLAGKGSLYLTRPTLFSYLQTRASVQALADELFGFVSTGTIQIPVRQRYPLTEVVRAHRELQARTTAGASVLLP